MSELARARIRVHIRGNEIEIEGSDEFIQREVRRVDEWARLLGGVPDSDAGATVQAPESEVGGPEANDVAGARARLPEAFRDWIAKMPQKKTERVKLLWAGYYAQLHSPDGTFRIRDVNRVLETEELTINYPSQVVLAAVKSGEVLRLTRGRYRVSNLVAQTIQAHFFA